MVTEEILKSLGYSSIEEYFERLYTEDVAAVYDLMFNEMSEQQQAEYKEFVTSHYYEYHDNKNNEQIVSSKTLEPERFPRRCDATGVGMHEGFVAVDGLYHFSEEKYLVEWLRGREDTDQGLSDEFLLEEAFALDEYYYTEWDIDDSDYWYEYGVDGQLVMVSEQQSILKDVYILYDEDRDKLHQFEDERVITYSSFERAYYWERALNDDEDFECKYETMEALHLPDHQIVRLHIQLQK